MPVRHRRLHAQRLVCTLAALSLLVITIPSVVLARITVNTVDMVASVTDAGRHLVLTGPIACTAGERTFVRLTVTQRATGAIAEGDTLVRCSGVMQQWEVHATTRGKEGFAAGPATTVAAARTTTRATTTDAHQWLVAVTLVSE